MIRVLSAYSGCMQAVAAATFVNVYFSNPEKPAVIIFLGAMMAGGACLSLFIGFFARHVEVH